MEIKHRAGLKHRNADSLSRHPCHQCGYTDDWDQENQVRAVQQVTTEEDNTGTDDTSEEKVMESLEKLQNDDTDISMIKTWLEKGNRPKASISKSQSAVVQSLASQWENLVLEKGVLFRKWTNDKSSGF